MPHWLGIAHADAHIQLTNIVAMATIAGWECQLRSCQGCAGVCAGKALPDALTYKNLTTTLAVLGNVRCESLVADDLILESSFEYVLPSRSVKRG